MKNKSIKKNYLEKVRPKQNKKWADKDKVLIISLKNKGMPSKDIAKKIGCNITQIYNITRLMRSGLRQKCYCCGKKLSPIELLQKGFIKSCDRCKKKFREYKKERLKKAHKKGLCGYCHKRKVIKGYKSCEKCVSATHRRRMLRGFCGQCGDRPPHKKGASLCILCLKKNELRINLKRRQHEKK